MKRRGQGEGTVRQRADGRWEAILSVGWTSRGRARKSFYGRTRADVVRQLDAARRQLASGAPLGDRTTLRQLSERYLSDVAPSRVRPRTLERYQQISNGYLLPALGGTRVAALTPLDVQRLLSNLVERGLSPRTAWHVRALLRTMLNVAMKWELVSRNVAVLADPPRLVDYQIDALSVERARSVLAAVEGDRLQTLFEVSLLLGLRQSEVLGLQWRDLDWETGTVRVARTLQRYGGAFHLDETKTSRSRRTLSLPPQLLASVRRHRARQLTERFAAGVAWEGDGWGDLVFCTAVGGPLHGSWSVTKRFQSLLAEAGLPRMTFHELRHGAATLMLSLGADPRTIMETLGHSQISTTMNVYAHVIPQLQREATARVGAALLGG